MVSRPASRPACGFMVGTIPIVTLDAVAPILLWGEERQYGDMTVFVVSAKVTQSFESLKL